MIVTKRNNQRSNALYLVFEILLQAPVISVYTFHMRVFAAISNFHRASNAFLMNFIKIVMFRRL